ncbi:MAG: lysophospholipid acyltransferase family protein [Promethearchaeota archaeon]
MMINKVLKIFRSKPNPLSRKALERIPRHNFFSASHNRFKILIFQKFIYMIFRLKNRLEVQDAKFLKNELLRSEPFLAVANHSCSLDVLLHQSIHAHFNNLTFSFISSEGFSSAKYPFISNLLYFAEQIPRYGTGSESVQRMIDRLKNGDDVLLFPEGTFNKGLVMEGFTGVARVIHGYWKQTGKKLRVLPACSIGGHEAYNPKAKFLKRMGIKRPSRRGQKIIVKFGEPFTVEMPEKPSKLELNQVTKHVMKKIAEIWGQKKIYPNWKRRNINKWIKTQGNARVYTR